MKALRHVAITASAGSGKTYQLAARFEELLARGVPPDRIAALTFSRKAAGEIFDALVERLCKSAREGGPKDRLRLLLQHVGRVRIGTLDSFAVGVVHAFPMELGLPAELELMDPGGPAASAAQRETLRLIFGRRAISPARRREFFEAFKQATFGREEKGLERNLSLFLQDFHSAYRRLPDGSRWGNERVIWPAGRLRTPSGEAADHLAELTRRVPALGLNANLEKSILRFAESAARHSPSAPWDEKVFGAKFVQHAFERLSDLADGRFAITYYNKLCEFPPDLCAHLHALVSRVVEVELQGCIESTRGLFQVLDIYEQVYDEQVRRRGRLTFEDVQYRLASGGGRLSFRAGDETRLYIDFRLDARLDHWLLDEFQDTSDLQWAAIGNLVDEVLQDTEGRRSLFYVGDVKQAIYGWRGGNARLFDRILERYGDRIETRPLHASFRSGPAVIETVNRVFAKLPEGTPEGAVRRWARHWAPHTVSEKTSGLSSYAALIEPPRGEDEKPDASDRYDVVAALLHEMRPAERGWTVAILVRTNDAAREVTRHLRAACPGLSVVHDGEAPLLDNPVVSVLASLVQSAAHPGDTFAWRHLQMSPLGRILPTRSDLTARVLRTIQESGYAELFREWGKRLEIPDAYGHGRWRDLIEAAAAFDRTGRRDPNEFGAYLESLQRKDEVAAAAVRVMTVHQSKGLGFDAVILPDLNDGSLVTSDSPSLLLALDESRENPVWALRAPRQLIRGTDATLTAVWQQNEEEEVFESLCVLYVALTRARRGLYLVTSYPGDSARSMTPAVHVKNCLAGKARPIELQGRMFDLLYEAGDRNWHARPAAPASPPAAPAPSTKRTIRPRRRLVSVSPSSRAEHPRGGDLLFAATTSRSLGIGSALHALFERIGWIEETDIEAVIRAWRGEEPMEDAIAEAAERSFRACLSSPEARAALTRPSASAILWREKSFDVVLGEEWVSGTFDRVWFDERRAEILDFKSNQVEDESDLAALVEDYAPQMRTYRRALAALLGRAERDIVCRLLFTSAGSVMPVA